MSATEHLREAIRRHGIPTAELARRLRITRDAVHMQFQRDHPREATLARYAAAMTAILHERGDRRRFTVESLRRGPEPLPDDEPTLAEAAMAAGFAARPWQPVLVRHFGFVPCGRPLVIDNEEAEWITVDRPSLGPHYREATCYLLTAAGYSMVAFGIHDGDTLVVHSDATAEHGSIVVAHVNGETVLRRLERADGHWLLVPGSPDYETRVVTARDELRILGVVTYVQPAGFVPGERRPRSS